MACAAFLAARFPLSLNRNLRPRAGTDHAIQRLEEELGGPLLHRERNLTQLTALGRAMLPPLEADAAGFRRREGEPLRLGIDGTLSARILASVLGELAMKFTAGLRHCRASARSPHWPSRPWWRRRNASPSRRPSVLTLACRRASTAQDRSTTRAISASAAMTWFAPHFMRRQVPCSAGYELLRPSRPGVCGLPNEPVPSEPESALARKIAVILHRMWRDGTDFPWTTLAPGNAA